MKKLMIIMLMGIILLIPFNTHAYDNGYQYGLPVYQLDQKISELNGYTLREVFEDANEVNYSLFSYVGITGVIIDGVLEVTISQLGTNRSIRQVKLYDVGHLMYVTNQFKPKYSYRYRYGWNSSTINVFNSIPNQWNLYSGIFEQSIDSPYILLFDANEEYTIGDKLYFKDIYAIDLTTLGLTNLTQEQLDHYFKYYKLALQYELDNKEAVKDSGQYKHIFMSIYEGLTNLMRSMGSFWRFLTTPFVDTTLSDMDNLFSIDWSWDIFDVLRQWVTNMAVWILQLNAVLIGTLFLILGIPLKVSILSLVFSDLVFVILGWIMIKSFII